MSIIDSIRLSGTTYQIQGSGGGGTQAIELTQAQYDALVDKDPNVFYIITDAEAGDLTNYYTKSETNTLLGGKQATLVSGTNIKTINNESILGSGNIDIQGGSTYTAGRGISIANDAISVSLPISAGTGTKSIVFGNATTAQTNGTNAFGGGKTGSAHYVVSFGQNSFSYGEGTQAYKNNSQSFGNETESRNISEHSIGQFNVSNSATTTFGNSGNTLFSVGNGTSNNARHNAFEIRQNGDIYLTKDGQDVKLQDTITATAANTTALGGLKLVKLSQSEYDNLATKDNSTLYVIVN